MATPQIVEDYNEAYRIRDLSPKSSATLSRRCLQSMVRNFWGVNDKKTLKEEIEAIQGKVDKATWEAIDSVRSVGNIDAHMEKDVDLIVSVEPGEAQLLLELIETLFAEWYVAKHDREQRMRALKRLGEEKKDLLEELYTQSNSPISSSFRRAIAIHTNRSDLSFMMGCLQSTMRRAGKTI